MTILFKGILFLLTLKYVLIVSGYFICYIATLGMRLFSGCGSLRQPVMRIKRDISEKTSKEGESVSQPVVHALPPGWIKSFLSRLVNGWLRYSGMYTGRIPSHFIRNFIYRHIYHLKLGEKAIIYGGSEIRAPYNITIGKGSIIGDDSKLDGRNGIVIGNNVNFSTGVWIWTDQHDPQSPDFSTNDQGGPVIIRDRAWLSCRTVILPGVTIGEGAVIAAGAIVTKDADPFGIYAGIPARKIGERNKNLVYEFNGRPLSFY